MAAKLVRTFGAQSRFGLQIHLILLHINNDALADVGCGKIRFFQT